MKITIKSNDTSRGRRGNSVHPYNDMNTYEQYMKLLISQELGIPLEILEASNLKFQASDDDVTTVRIDNGFETSEVTIINNKDNNEEIRIEKHANKDLYPPRLTSPFSGLYRKRPLW